MNETLRPPTTPSSEALLRYAVLAQVEALTLGGWAVGEAVREVAGREHVHPDGRSVRNSRVSVRTIQRWRAAYAGGGIEALEPRSRRRTESSLALSEALVAFLRAEKECDPRASVPELLRRARLRGIIPTDLPVDRITAWRACRRMGLVTRARPSKREGDMRRWRYAHRMQCVLCDGKHFRAGGARLRRVALFFLDDATRYGLDVMVGTSESTVLFLRGLYDLVTKHGLADLLYLDRGPGFISADTLAVVEGGLGAWLIHGTARYPPGRGAVERFNRTAQEQVLRSLDGAAEVDPDCGALTLRLRHFLDSYNGTPHETLGGDTPRQRWEAGRPLRFPDDEADLRRRFVVREPRKVSTDHVIKAGGRLWEAPRGLGERWIEVLRHVLDGRLWVCHEGRIFELAELDPHANATERRGGAAEGPLHSEAVPTTAASLAFGHDLLPILDADGGFSDPQSDPQDEEEDA
jgi:putative transposase